MGFCCRPFKYEVGNDEFFKEYKSQWDDEYGYDENLKPNNCFMPTELIRCMGKMWVWRSHYDIVNEYQKDALNRIKQLEKILEKQKLNGGEQIELKENELNEFRQRTLARVETWKIKWEKYPDSLKTAILRHNPNSIEIAFGVTV